MIIPKYLYRFYKKRGHREEFIKGRIRFGRLELYRNIEDEKRRDADEGKPRGKYRTNKQLFLNINNTTGEIVNKGYQTGDIFISGDSPNKFFILCVSDENANLKLLAKRLGKYATKITNPQKFLDLLNNNCTFSWNVGKIVLEQVKYDKDDYIKMEENNPYLPIRYYFAQKSNEFAHEHEWRIVITGSAIDKVVEQYVWINIGSIKSITHEIDL